MSDLGKQCEGQVIDNRFPLQKCLGGTEDSAVFLTQLAAPQSQKAAIKFILAGPAADLQLSLWRRTMQLAHPNLLRIIDVGRCRLENRDRLYAVMEFAEEDLSQILPQRPLTASEARETLGPVLDALVYLHGNGLIHSRIKPSNILATADQLKLSSDTLFPIGESRKSPRKADAHDAPETAASPLSPAADVWSLGMTLVETLTQHAPALPHGSQADPIVPDTLPEPFLDIARHTLRRDPRRRWNLLEIGARLNPVAAAAAAAQSVSPLAVPLSTVPAIPAAKLQIPHYDPPPPRPQAQTPRSQATNASKQTVLLPNYVVPAVAVVLVIIAIIALPKILGHRSGSSSSTSTAAAQPEGQPTPAEPPARREASPAPKQSAPSAAQDPLKTTAEKKSPAQPQNSPVAAPTPASVRTDSLPSANAPGVSPSSPGRGEVLDQVLPDVSAKARATIQGVVRVSVRVHVDPTGNVSEAALDSPASSQYFSDLALKAARRWQFTSPEKGGHSVPSEWLIRFQFSPSGPKAFPRQIAP